VGASADSTTNGKQPTDAAPMIVSSQPPGCFAIDDSTWQSTFGASHDCVLGIFSGKFFKADKDKIVHDKDTVWRDSIGTADLNILEVIDINGDSIQQVAYIVSKDSVDDASGESAYETYGDIEEARTIGLRIPAMAVGYGRTVGMRPTDPDPQDTNKRKNDDEHKLARETWKHGPIDVRWDERRGVWAAWNDLIADWTDEKRLGTLVFDTNKDAECGFPFIKGKLEDVWKVIKTEKFEKITGKDADDQKSADVCTHLSHNWTKKDDGIWKYCPLSSNFTIHRVGDDPKTVTCGDDKSQSALGIEILVGTWFHMSTDNKDGPICFSGEKIEDDELVGCLKYQGDPGKGQWVPAVPFDPCDRVGFELGICFDNDVTLAQAIEDVCCLVLELHGFKNPNGDPAKLKKAGAAGGAAADANKKASDAIGADPDSGNAELDGARDAAKDAYKKAEEANRKSQESANAAAETAEAANDAAGKHSVNQEAVEAATKKYNEAADKLAKQPNDGSTREAERKAKAELEAAQAEARKSKADYDKKAEANDKTQAEAKKDGKAANEAGDAAKEAGDKYSDKYGEVNKDKDGNPEKPPSQDEMDAADKANKDAKDARNDADIGDDQPTAEEAAQEAKDCCEEAKAAIGKLSGDVGKAITAGMDAINQNMQDTIDGLVDGINDALGEIMDATGASFDETRTRAGAGTVTKPSVTQDSGGDGGPPNDGGGTTTGGGGTKPRDGGSGGTTGERPGGGGGTPVDPGDVGNPSKPPDAPDCPVIRLKDPCAPGIPHTFTCPPGAGGQGRGAVPKPTQRQPGGQAGGVDKNGNIMGQGNDAGKKAKGNPGWRDGGIGLRAGFGV